MARILGIGIATLDIILLVDGYPQEDAEVRAVGQRICRGGNATNTLVVLSQLGHACAWGGVIVDEPDGARILDDLKRHGVDTRYCPVERAGKVPTSYVALNRRNGSRTIIHYRDLREFGFEDFRKIDPALFDWIHFEGRNVAETERMLAHLAASHSHIPRSVEIEKPRPGIERLFQGADVLLFSKTYAAARGFADPVPFLRAMRDEAPAAELICAWGAQGAHALTRDGRDLYCPAFPPPQVVDTLGAGDTFNAGIIDALVRGRDMAAALQNASRLAGRKCGRLGLDGLGEGVEDSHPRP